MEAILRPLLSHQFQQSLVALSIEGHTSLTAALVAAANRTKGLKGRVKAILRAYVRWYLSNPALYQVMLGPRVNGDGLFPELDAAVTRTLAPIRTVFLTDGGFADQRADELTHAFATQAHGFCDLVARRVRIRSTRSGVDYASRLFSPFVAGICEEANRSLETESVAS